MEVFVPVGEVSLEGSLVVPDGATGLILFAHGSGSSRHSPRNRHVARVLRDAGLGTLLIDLLTAEEEQAERWTRHLRFDIELLARRLVGATLWLARNARTSDLRIGCFGASTGAAAALDAAAREPNRIVAVVSRGGRPDLASKLDDVRAPTLLIVGENDPVVLDLNREVVNGLRSETKLEIIKDAGHLFEEPGALECVAELATQWFVRHVARGALPVRKEARTWP